MGFKSAFSAGLPNDGKSIIGAGVVTSAISSV